MGKIMCNKILMCNISMQNKLPTHLFMRKTRPFVSGASRASPTHRHCRPDPRQPRAAPGPCTYCHSASAGRWPLAVVAPRRGAARAASSTNRPCSSRAWGRGGRGRGEAGRRGGGWPRRPFWSRPDPPQKNCQSNFFLSFFKFRFLSKL